jgi:hypothetical protein
MQVLGFFEVKDWDLDVIGLLIVKMVNMTGRFVLLIQEKGNQHKEDCCPLKQVEKYRQTILNMIPILGVNTP